MSDKVDLTLMTRLLTRDVANMSKSPLVPQSVRDVGGNVSELLAEISMRLMVLEAALEDVQIKFRALYDE